MGVGEVRAKIRARVPLLLLSSLLFAQILVVVYSLMYFFVICVVRSVIVNVWLRIYVTE
jgi:hypothetical protein